MRQQFHLLIWPDWIEDGRALVRHLGGLVPASGVDGPSDSFAAWVMKHYAEERIDEVLTVLRLSERGGRGIDGLYEFLEPWKERG